MMSKNVSSSPLTVPGVSFISGKFLAIWLFPYPNTLDRSSALSFQLVLCLVLINLLLTPNSYSFKIVFLPFKK